MPLLGRLVFHVTIRDHWQLLMNINAPMYENMSDCNRGEHLEVTLTKLRQNMLDYTACAKSLLNDLV